MLAKPVHSVINLTGVAEFYKDGFFFHIVVMPRAETLHYAYGDGYILLVSGMFHTGQEVTSPRLYGRSSHSPQLTLLLMNFIMTYNASPGVTLFKSLVLFHFFAHVHHQSLIDQQSVLKLLKDLASLVLRDGFHLS